MNTLNAEQLRMEEDERRIKNWKRWGPYLSERQWGTVREDYSEGGSPWDYFPMIMHEAGRTAGVRTDCSASQTARAVCASPLPFGMKMTPS